MFSSPAAIRRRRWSPRSVVAIAIPVAVVVAVVLLTGGDGTRERGRAGAAAAANPVAGFIDRLAAPWPKVQLPEGHPLAGDYREPVSGTTRYGNALLGYAEILTGLRTHRPVLIRSGLRALRFAVP